MESKDNIAQTPKQKAGKRMLKFSLHVLNEIKPSGDTRLRNQNQSINYFEEIDSSESKSEYNEHDHLNKNHKTSNQFLKKKTSNNDSIEYNTDNNSITRKTIPQRTNSVRKRIKFTHKLKCPKKYKRSKIKTGKIKEEKDNDEDKSYKTPKNYEEEYSKDYMNVSVKQESRIKILETISSASKIIYQHFNEYCNIEKEKNKKSGYPEDCIPINVDLTLFDFKDLIDKQKALTNQLFDVILIDPPWHLSGATPSRGVIITFEKLKDEHICKLKNIDKLQTDGFIFIWTINGRFEVVFDLLEKWGYTYCDMINWVKTTRNGKFAKGHGYYLQHTKETCIVGIKGNPKFKKDFSNCDLIFSQRRGQSQKPNELYEKIERIISNGYYLELFGRRNNLRNNWITIGNEI